MNALFDKGTSFLQDIKNSEKVLLIHHTDVDGYCSGAIFLKALQFIGRSVNFDLKVMAAANEELEYFIKTGKASDYDKIIVLDIDAPYLDSDFKNQKGGMLIIDHHSIKTDLNSAKIAYVNPRLLDSEIYQPASYVVYKFISYASAKLGIRELSIENEKIEWVSVLGTISDFAYDDCRDVLEKWVGREVKEKKDVVKTKFWEASKKYYGAIIAWEGDDSDKMKPLLEAAGIDQLLSDGMIGKMNEVFEHDRARSEEEFWGKADVSGNIVFSKINPKFKRVGSVIATDLGIKNHDKVIIVLERRGSDFKVHSRCQDGRVHMGEVMNACCRSGGGHREAAGGTIHMSDYDAFRSCVISEIKKRSDGMKS
jgi:single-stranded DNA-specific DHH superfamily exonuclease